MPPPPPVPPQPYPAAPGQGVPYGYGQQPGAVPHGYPQAPYGYPQAAHGYPQAAGPVGCQMCGAGPAAPVTVRGHQGMVVIMRSLKRQGMLCRTCALSVFREMQAETLVAGWWGPLSVLITPFVLLANLGALSGIRRLPAPVTPGWRPPLDPGKPVFQRPAGVLALIPLGLLGLLVTLVTGLLLVGLVPSVGGGDAHLKPGSCAVNDGDWTEQDLRSVPCDSVDAQFRVVDPEQEPCAKGDFLAEPRYSTEGIGLCLRPVR